MIRPAIHKDIVSINAIYNQAVRSLGKTADLKEIPIVQHQRWYEERDSNRYPILVLEVDHKVIGYFHYAPYRKGREALNVTAEITYYLDEGYHGKGYGTQLLTEGIGMADSLGFTTLIAILLDGNDASIGILRKFGFEEWGRMPEAAIIDGSPRDHLYFGRKT